MTKRERRFEPGSNVRRPPTAWASTLLLFLSLGLSVLLAAGCRTTGGNESQTDHVQRVRRLLEDVPLIDGHNDLPWQVRNKAGGDVAAIDLAKPQPELHTDIQRLREGGLGAQFWSVFVPTSLKADEAVRATLEQIDIVHQLVREYPEEFQLCWTADDIERAHGQGRIGSLIGMEGGHSINSSLQVLRMFYELGARYMTLTHSKNVPWADSCTDEPVVSGLNSFGEEVILEMNHLGMLIDCSHVSADAMRDAIRVSTAPIIFSHSSARGLTGHVRNVPDDVLRSLTQKDGVVMVTFVPRYVSESTRLHAEMRTKEHDRLTEQFGDNQEQIRGAFADWEDTNPSPRATLNDVADHIDYIRRVAGIDHVGIGSDFDGIGSVPQGLEDVSKYIDLLVELSKRGYSDDDIRKLIGENLLRVFRKVEAIATDLSGVPRRSAPSLRRAFTPLRS